MGTTQKLILEPGRATKDYWRDMFHYRELFFILAWRDVVVRYKQTAAGLAWALIQPLMSIIIMAVIFGKVAGLPSEGNVPYAIMVCAAMLPWQFFANALSMAGQSVVNNSNLISKIYFPAHDCSGQFGGRFPGGLSGGVFDPRRADGVVSLLAHLAFARSARACPAGHCGGAGAGPDFDRPDGPLSRLSHDYSVPGSIRTVCLPGCA